METINLKVDQLSGNEIIIREGNALEQKPPEKIKITGDVHTVRRYLDKEHSGIQKVDKTKALILVDRKAGIIGLFVDPENHYGPEITAKLEESDELAVWNINRSKTYTREELVKLLRFNKLHFDNVDKHTQVLEAYQKFNASTKSEMEASSDQRGNKAAAYKKEVTSNIPTEFILKIPIFKWEEEKRFRVEIAMDNTESSWRFWFESVELHEMLQTEKDRIFNQELEDFKDEFVIISK